MLWAVRDSGVRTAQEEHGCPSSFTLKSLLRPIHPLFFHYSSALFPGKCSLRLSHQLQTALFPLQCHTTSLSSLCGIQPLKCQFTAAVFSPRHISLLSACQCHPSHFHACADFTSFSVCVLLAVNLSVFPLYICLCVSLLFALSLSLTLPLFGLQAEVLDSQRRSTGLNDGLVNGVTDNSAN